MASQSKIVAELIGTSGQIAADKLAPGAGGTNWTESVVTSSTLSAAINTGYYLNTTNNSIFVDLPSTSSPGGVISLVDVAATANSNRITIRPANGNKINGEFYDMDIDVQRGGAQLTYSGADFGWIATEAVNGLEGTNRTGKILVESNPVVTSVVNTTDSLAYFQADADEVVLTGRNIKPNSVISFVKASGGAPIDYTVQAGDLNATATQVTFNLPAGMDDDAANDPFDVYVTLPTSLDNPTVPLASPQVNNNLIEWLPTPTFTNAAGSLGFIYSDDVDLSSLTFTSVAATSLDAGDTITYSDDGNLPAGLSVNTTTGTVEGTLSASFGNSGSTVNTFVVTATAEGETGVTKSETRTYSIELRSTKVTNAYIASGTPTTYDYDGGSGTTVQVVGYGFNGTDTVSAVNFITGGNSYAVTDPITIINDNNLTINTPQAFTTAQSNLDVEVVLTSGYTYKLSQSTGTTLLTTGSNPVAGSPYTLTNILSERGSYSATLPTPTDADGNTTFTFTLGTVTQTVNSVTTDLSANANTFSFTLNSTTGVLTATVPTNYETSGGTITLPVTIEDNAGNTSSQNYTITVDAVVTSIYTTEITNSLMFDGSSYLSRQWNQAYTSQTMTYSFWIKFSDLSTTNTVLWAGISPQDSSNDDAFDFYLNKARIYTNSGNGSIGSSTALFRDTSSWYHFVMTADSTNGMRVYVNGGTSPILTVPSGFTNINFTNNGSYAQIGAQAQIASLRGYLANIYLIDGQALTPSSFGEYATLGTDTYWIPKEYDYLPQGTPSQRYGNNGFHLTFAPNTISGTGPTYTIADVSGNGNDWTATGF